MGTKVKLESLGVYVPEKIVTMEQKLQGCVHRPGIDLERLTGIHQFHVAENEYAVDLAIQAARRALSMSKYGPEQLGAIICTSISKHHAEDLFTFEPATALLVRKAIGAKNTLVFDVVNACAGMINGIYLLQSLIRAGQIRCGMVVSGEHNLPLSRTAARELRHSLDGQLAALTLGDCGAAVVVDGSEEPAHGFHWVDLVTGAKHNHYCYSMPSRQGPGGIVVTKARGLQVKGNQHFPYYTKQALDASGWSVDDVHHLIPHQVAPRAIRTGTRALQKFIGAELSSRVLNCADRYGNTTTTSHFLALHEFILRGKINSGHNVLLISGASGIAISHATFTFDDLPDRYRAHLAQEART